MFSLPFLLLSCVLSNSSLLCLDDSVFGKRNANTSPNDMLLNANIGMSEEEDWSNHTDAINCLCLMGNKLISASRDGSIIVWGEEHS